MEASGSLAFVRSPNRGGAAAHLAIALVALAAVYTLVDQRLSRGGIVEFYIVQPFVWLALAALILGLSRKGQQRLSFSPRLLPLAFLCAALQVSLLVIGGLLVGFGHSVVSHTPLVNLENLTWAFSSLVALELCRAYFIVARGRDRPVLAVAASACLFTFVGLSLAMITASFDGGPVAIRFVGGKALPLLLENVLASYLALLGGPLPAIAYRGSLVAFDLLSPVLPALPWMGRALVGTLAPIIGMRAVHSVCEPAPAPAAAAHKRRSRVAGGAAWVVLSVAGVGIVWFSIGLFPVVPQVTEGSSMYPAFRNGDVAIIRKVSPDSIREGDIIRYYRSGRNLWILHRVVSVDGVGSEAVFTTKGDNNNVVDSWTVPAADVTGKVVGSIPKVGHIGFMIRRLFGLME